MATVYIGIGSNLGNRERNCLQAMEELFRKGLGATRKSSLYETEPWGVRDQPAFVNMVIGVETDLSPREILSIIKDIERKLGRIDGKRWGPREIDLDILLCGDLILDEPNLKIPHPSMHEREFVLEPLVEIAPEIHHPVLKKTVTELLALLHSH
jgi:2-amino-4-hydroxy-6-hydroxymethyldihydropteridine diphosphokinase